MLSESEQRRLADIEAEFKADRRYIRRMYRLLNTRTLRRLLAVLLAMVGATGVVLSLRLNSVAGAVASDVLVGAAGCVWTWEWARGTSPSRRRPT